MFLSGLIFNVPGFFCAVFVLIGSLECSALLLLLRILPGSPAILTESSAGTERPKSFLLQCSVSEQISLVPLCDLETSEMHCVRQVLAELSARSMGIALLHQGSSLG